MAEFIVFVIIPILFVLFSPYLWVSLLIMAVTGCRLSYTFYEKSKNNEYDLTLWHMILLAASAVITFLSFFIKDEKLFIVFLYVALLMAIRCLISYFSFKRAIRMRSTKLSEEYEKKIESLRNLSAEESLQALREEMENLIKERDSFRQMYEKNHLLSLAAKEENEAYLSKICQMEETVRKLSAEKEAARKSLVEIMGKITKMGELIGIDFDPEDASSWEKFENAMNNFSNEQIKKDPQRYEEIRKSFEDIYSCFDQEMLRFLATGEFFRQQYGETKGMDLSLIVVPYSKTVELAMHRIFNNDKCMLGKALERINKHPEKWENRFIVDLDRLREYRNKAAHSGNDIVDTNDVHEVYRILFEQEKYRIKGIKGMLAYLNLKLM